jgi:hypothetical protein
MALTQGHYSNNICLPAQTVVSFQLGDILLLIQYSVQTPDTSYTVVWVLPHPVGHFHQTETVG